MSADAGIFCLEELGFNCSVFGGRVIRPTSSSKVS